MMVAGNADFKCSREWQFCSFFYALEIEGTESKETEWEREQGRDRIIG